VQPTGGIRPDLQAFFWLRVFPTSQTLSTPAHPRVTQTVSWQNVIMSETGKASSRSIFLWFPIVSISTYIGVLLSSSLGTILFRLRRNSYTASDDGDLELILSFIFLVSLFMGFGQWFVINTRIKRVHYWIPATIIGFLLGSIVYFFIFANMLLFLDVYYHRVISFMLVGMFAGICQCVSMKKKPSILIKWSLITGVGLAFGHWLALLVSNYTSNLFISWMFFSTAIGLITGIFAEPMIIRPKTENINQ